jgi:two-component system chemotaxis response regulator CheB
LKIEDITDEKILYKPSVNITLDSAAPIYKERLLAVILTGMGNDGLMGCRSVKKYNGHIIVEAEESCIVYGMPKAVFEAGLADIQVTLPNILEKIIYYI